MPVIVLADSSGSMQGEKIAALNAALRELVEDLGRVEDPRLRLHIAVVRFGGSVEQVLKLTPAADARIPSFSAAGETPLGAAIELVRDLLETPESMPTRSYSPTIVLVSDGRPTDDAASAITRLQASPRGGRATRLALAIGNDCDLALLRAFVANPEVPVMLAKDVSKLRQFFAWVSFSVRLRSRSRMPEQSLVAPTDDIDDQDLRF